MKITCCPSCGSNFTIWTAAAKSVNKQPLVLSCGHTFCESCVMQKWKKVTNSDGHQAQVACPTCKHITFTENGVKDLPVNVYLSAYIDMNQRGRWMEQLGLNLGHLVPAVASRDQRASLSGPDLETKESKCKLCVVKKATCKCVDCDIMLCGNCFKKVHSLSVAIKHHVPVGLSSVCQPVTTGGSDGEVKCAEHNRILEYFCEDDSVSICSRCYIVGRHQNHSITSIEDKNKYVLEDISSELPKARLVLQHLSRIDKKIASGQPNMKAEIKSLIENVNASFFKLHSLIQAREMEIIRNINSAYKEHIVTIDQQRDMMDKTRNELEEAIRKSSQLFENNATFIDGHALLETLRKARTTPCIVVKRDAMEDAQLKWHEIHTDNLTAIINAYGSISGAPQMIQFSTIEEAPEHVDDDDKVSVDSLGSESSLPSVGGAASVPGSADTGEDVMVEDIDAESDVPRSNQHVSHEPISLPVIKGPAQKVTVTHIRSPNEFYVQLASSKRQLDNLAHNINIWCRKSNSSKHVPLVIEKEMFLLARYTADKQWYRATVLGVEKSADDKDNNYKVHVKYIDFGNDELLPMKELRVMQARFMKYPVFAVLCSLTNTAPMGEDTPWSMEAIQEFHKMTQNQMLMMTAIKTQGAVYEVDLTCIPMADALDDNYVSVRDILIFLGLASFRTFSDASITSAAPPAYPKVDFIQPISVKNGATLSVVVLRATSPWDVQVVCLGEEYEYYLGMHEEMQQMYNKDICNIYSLFYPRVDMVCAAKGSDGQWYRAKVLSSPANKEVSVKLVDRGTTETVRYDHLKKLHTSFIRLPIQAIPCQLVDVCPVDGPTGHWSDEAKLWCANNLTSVVGQARFFRCSENIPIVLWLDNSMDLSEPQSVNFTLVDQGCAQSTGPSSVSNVEETSVGSVVFKAGHGDYKKGHSKEAAAISSLRDALKRTSIATNSSKSTVSKTSSPKTVLKKTLASSANNKTELRKKDTSRGQRVGNQKPAEEGVSTQPDLKQVLNSNGCSPSQKLETSYIEVYISNYVSPSEFYVQVTDTQDDLLQLMKDMQEVFCDSQPALSQRWSVNDYCAAIFTPDNLWYRANIVGKVSEDEFEVEYVDFGNVDVVKTSNLQLLPPEFGQRMPCAAARCHLANLLPAGSMDVNKWSQTAAEFMASVMNNRKLYIKQEGDPTGRGLPVDLIVEEDIPETAFEPKSQKYHSMRKAIIRNGLAMPAKKESDPSSPDSPGPILFQRFIYTNENQPESHSQDKPELTDFNKNLPPSNTTNNSQMTTSAAAKEESVVESVSVGQESHKGDILSLPPYPLPQLKVQMAVVPTCVGPDGSIYVQPIAWADRCARLKCELQRIYGLVSSVDNTEWKVGLFCVVLRPEDGHWCRAQILDIEDDKFKVCCIDFGNTAWVQRRQLREMLPAFAQDHPLVYHCVLYDLAPISPLDTWPIVVLDQIQRLIVNCKCVVVVIEADRSSPLKIQLFKDDMNLCEELIHKHMAVSPLTMKRFSKQSCLIGQVLSRQNPYHQLDVGEVGDTFRALMIHIELPNVIYLQRDLELESEVSDFVRASEVAEINNSIAEFVDMAEKLKSCRSMPVTCLPDVGMMCAAHYSVDNQLYRALCVQCFPETNSCLVVYVDYGTSEIVARSSLRLLPSEFWSVPAQAIRCNINHPTACGSAQPLKHYSFITIVNSLARRQLMARIVGKSPLVVELMVEEAGRWQVHYKNMFQKQQVARPSRSNRPVEHGQDDAGGVDTTPQEVCQEQNHSENWSGESGDEREQSSGSAESEAAGAVASAVEVGNEDGDDDDDDDVDWVAVAAQLVKQTEEK